VTRETLQLSVRLLVLLVALSLVFLFVSRPAEAEAPQETVEYVVAAGDTLWQIAGHVPHEGDVRGVILEIQDLNGLESGTIYPGQVLLLPAG
jgi:LysM repeat protein